MDKQKYILILLFGLFLVTTNGKLKAENDTAAVKKVFVFNLKEMIAPPAWHTTRQAINEAEQLKADLILIEMNTYGGLLDAADSIRTKILDTSIPVFIFINKNAASAGALISLACDSIYMAPGANIGAATVVDQQGKPLPDKYQSYMRSLMRSTAEVTGRDPKIAQAMVDPRLFVSGVSDSGQVLSMTPSEAIAHGFCEAEVNNIKEILAHAGVSHYKIVSYKISATDQLVRFLIRPWISALLIMIIIGGLYFELQTPGIGFPLAAAIIAALLYFAPLYMQGMASHWEIILFLVGLVLIILELFVIPGFGIAGISGILFTVSGLSLALIRTTGPGFFDLDMVALAKAFFLVIIASTLALFGSIYLTKLIFGSRRFGYLGLEKTQEREEGYSTAINRYAEMLGHQGICLTKLRPAGKVQIDNQVFDAVAKRHFIEKDEKVEVIGYRQAQLVVKRKED